MCDRFYIRVGIVSHGQQRCAMPYVARMVDQLVRRPSREHLVFTDWPLALCVVIGTVHGRWHAEFWTRKQRGTQGLYSASLFVSVTCRKRVLRNRYPLESQCCKSWHFVHDTAGHEHTWCMMEACKGCSSSTCRREVLGAQSVGKHVENC